MLKEREIYVNFGSVKIDTNLFVENSSDGRFPATQTDPYPDHPRSLEGARWSSPFNQHQESCKAPGNKNSL